MGTEMQWWIAPALAIHWVAQIIAAAMSELDVEIDEITDVTSTTELVTPDHALTALISATNALTPDRSVPPLVPPRVALTVTVVSAKGNYTRPVGVERAVVLPVRLPVYYGKPLPSRLPQDGVTSCFIRPSAVVELGRALVADLVGRRDPDITAPNAATGKLPGAFVDAALAQMECLTLLPQVSEERDRGDVISFAYTAEAIHGVVIPVGDAVPCFALWDTAQWPVEVV